MTKYAYSKHEESRLVVVSPFPLTNTAELFDWLTPNKIVSAANDPPYFIRMSAFAESKLDNDLVAKAVNALLKYELKKAGEGSKGKALLVSNYAKPVLVQVRFTE